MKYLPTMTADQSLRTAIANRQLVSFTLDRCHRVAEPHDYGVINGIVRLFFYQVRGESRSKGPLGWRWATVSKIADLRLLEERFPGPRPAPSGKHIHWDMLIATVSPRLVSQPPVEPSSAKPRKRRR